MIGCFARKGHGPFFGEQCESLIFTCESPNCVLVDTRSLLEMYTVFVYSLRIRVVPGGIRG